MLDRIPFAEAIDEPLLFQKAFKALSTPQQMILKVVYGLPLTADELIYWSAFQGKGIYDNLGFLEGISADIPYSPQEYSDITLCLGRRSGKTSAVSSFIVAYEALCGGHKKHVGAKQDPVFLQVAQDLVTARGNLRQFIQSLLESSSIGARELTKGSTTADMIRLPGGLITVGPPTIKLRGQAIACCAMDELGVWSKDRDSANPDTEVQAAVLPALMQFYPFDKMVKTSTPMTEEGLLWQAVNIGTKGSALKEGDEAGAYKRTLVMQCPSAAMGNPKCSRSYLIEQRQKDADAFPREYLAQFAKSLSGFLNADLLRAAVTQGVRFRSPQPGQLYLATLDPAFRRDAFAFCIGHLENGKFVQDYIQSWRPDPGQTLSPGYVLDEVAVTCRKYGVTLVASDQYNSPTLMEMSQARGLTLEAVPFTAQLKPTVWATFNSMLQQSNLLLVQHEELLDELLKMERKITQYGNVQVFGKRDDLATVTALCVYRAMQYGEPRRSAPRQELTRPQEARKRVQAKVKSEMQGEDQAWWQG